MFTSNFSGASTLLEKDPKKHVNVTYVFDEVRFSYVIIVSPIKLQ
jgi:hypothetical protein